MIQKYFNFCAKTFFYKKHRNWQQFLTKNLDDKGAKFLTKISTFLGKNKSFVRLV